MRSSFWGYPETIKNKNTNSLLNWYFWHTSVEVDAGSIIGRRNPRRTCSTMLSGLMSRWSLGQREKSPNAHAERTLVVSSLSWLSSHVTWFPQTLLFSIFIQYMILNIETKEMKTQTYSIIYVPVRGHVYLLSLSLSVCGSHCWVSEAMTRRECVNDPLPPACRSSNSSEILHVDDLVKWQRAGNWPTQFCTTRKRQTSVNLMFLYMFLSIFGKISQRRSLGPERTFRDNAVVEFPEQAVKKAGCGSGCHHLSDCWGASPEKTHGWMVGFESPQIR